jgi:hypothetical protein
METIKTYSSQNLIELLRLNPGYRDGEYLKFVSTVLSKLKRAVGDALTQAERQGIENIPLYWDQGKAGECLSYDWVRTPLGTAIPTPEELLVPVCGKTHHPRYYHRVRALVRVDETTWLFQSAPYELEQMHGKRGPVTDFMTFLPGNAKLAYYAGEEIVFVNYDEPDEDTHSVYHGTLVNGVYQQVNYSRADFMDKIARDKNGAAMPAFMKNMGWVIRAKMP